MTMKKVNVGIPRPVAVAAALAVAGFGPTAATGYADNQLAGDTVRFRGTAEGLDCSLSLTVGSGQITSFEATGVGTSKAIDLFGTCDGGGLYPCRQKGALKSGLLGFSYGDAESFASVTWKNTSFSANGFELEGLYESSDSTRKVRLSFDGASFIYKETVSIDGLGLLVAAEQKTACAQMTAVQD